MNKTSAIIIIGMVLIGGVVVFWKGSSGSASGIAAGSGDNVAVVDGKQIVTIIAKGGYSPRVSNVKADTPTTLRVISKGTFDCSIALRIPALGYSKNLNPNDSTDIDIPPQKSGTSLNGFCSMGMYNFRINFE